MASDVKIWGHDHEHPIGFARALHHKVDGRVILTFVRQPNPPKAPTENDYVLAYKEHVYREEAHESL